MNARFASLAMIGFATAGTLAGCAASTPQPNSDGRPPVIDASSAATFTDGDYSANGPYFAPSGQESVDVTLTLADGAVTAISVHGNATDPEAKQYEAQFVSGVNALVIGKPIDSLDVTNVAGSSLTSSGFDAAVANIIDQAQQ